MNKPYIPIYLKEKKMQKSYTIWHILNTGDFMKKLSTATCALRDR